MKLALPLTIFFFLSLCDSKIFAQCKANFVKDTGSVLGIQIPASLTYSAPAFADIDNDGDDDLFVGGYIGDIKYYQNIGTSNDPQFGANPFLLRFSRFK